MDLSAMEVKLQTSTRAETWKSKRGSLVDLVQAALFFLQCPASV